MLKKALLVSTAIVGLAVVSAPADATVLYSGYTTAASPTGVTPDINFSGPGGAKVDVYVDDCCVVGDYYATYLDGGYIGTTPYEPEYGSSSGYPNSSATFLATLGAGSSHYVQLVDQTDFYLPAGVYVSISTAAPEPSTWAMMGLGFAGLAFAGYRSSRKKAAALA